MKQILLLIVGVVIGCAIGAAIYSVSRETTLGAAPAGLAATVSTSTQLAVSTGVTTVLATSTNCASRTIGTAGSAIMLTFTEKDGQTPSGTRGFPQAASTTVTYDCATFGNGAIKVYSFAASTIEAQETR